jgi:hypothetical protein
MDAEIKLTACDRAGCDDQRPEAELHGVKHVYLCLNPSKNARDTRVFARIRSYEKENEPARPELDPDHP